MIVELDGEVHAEPVQAARDENRDALLRSLGYQIMRFSNEQVLKSPESVLREIAHKAKRAHPLE